MKVLLNAIDMLAAVVKSLRPLNDAELTQTYPLGCSNWFKEDRFNLSFRKGLLVVAFCGD